MSSLLLNCLPYVYSDIRSLDQSITSLVIPKLGCNDFNNVAMCFSRFTQIESVNINGTLNQTDGRRRALIDVPLMKLPSKFYEIGFKPGSRNTIVVVCDQGWNVSMRIHNASSKIEPSLKFDVQLIAMPSSILTQIEPWSEHGTIYEYDFSSSVGMVAEDSVPYGKKDD